MIRCGSQNNLFTFALEIIYNYKNVKRHQIKVEHFTYLVHDIKANLSSIHQSYRKIE